MMADGGETSPTGPSGELGEDRRYFKFAEVFPAEDLTGQFVLRLALAANALRLTNKLLLEHWDALSVSEHLALARDTVVHTWETQKVVSEGAKQPNVAAFIEECGQAYTGDFLPGTELVDLLLGREGAAAPPRRNVLNEVRNLTVHFGQPQKGKEDQIPTVLAALAAEDETGAVVLGESPRAEFADDVLYLLTKKVGLDLEDPEFLQDLSRTVVAIVQLADTAVGRLVRQRRRTGLRT